MLTGNIIFISLTVIFLVGVKSSNAKVSCTTCLSLQFNLTSEAELDSQGCTLQDGDICSLVLTVDYTNRANSNAFANSMSDTILVLTNGEAQVSETTFIWFNEIRVQRTAMILCFDGTSCGFDLMKEIYKDKFRPFDYKTIQNKLSEQLYSPSPSSSLTCADLSGPPVSCSHGFCRTSFDGNGLVISSTCVKKALAYNPYGLTVTKTTMGSYGEEQTAIIFTCNKPMCNSKEATQQVMQQLVAAQVIPEPATTTTVSQIDTHNDSSHSNNNIRNQF